MADYIEVPQAPAAIGVGETRPLLTRGESTFSSRKSKHQRLTTIGIGIQMALTGFGLFLEMAPQTSIFQDIVCEEYFQNTSSIVHASEANCKIEPVQSQVALINGWKDTFDQIPSIFLAIPYGLLADRIGRKPVLFMCILGFFLECFSIRLICWFPKTFPIRLVWLTPIFTCLGGGSQMLVSMLFTMLADVSTAEQRTTAFSVIISVFLLTQIIAIPASAAIMAKTGPWVPYLIGLALQATGVVYCLFLPETYHFVQKTEQAQTSDSDLDSGDSRHRNPLSLLKDKTLEIGRFIKREPTMCLFFSALFAGVIAAQSQQNTLILYVSRRYPWSIGQASMLLSIRSLIFLGVLLIILPALRKLLSDKYKVPAAVIDLNLARVSCFLLAAGSIIIGLAPHVSLVVAGVVFFALGQAFDLIVRSSATMLVPASYVAVLYTALAVTQSVGIFVGGPLLAVLWKSGMLLGPMWEGLPFISLGSLLGLIGLLFMLIRAPKDEVEEGATAQAAGQSESDDLRA